MATKTPTPTHLAAYAAGHEYHGASLLAAWETELYGPARVNAESPIAAAFFEAGVLGHAHPRWVEGWRYGRLPESGSSRNHRDDCSERGVSVMAIDGDIAPQTDGTFALFNGGRPRVRVAGWLIGFRGSDGEPLLVGAIEL